MFAEGQYVRFYGCSDSIGDIAIEEGSLGRVINSGLELQAGYVSVRFPYITTTFFQDGSTSHCGCRIELVTDNVEIAASKLVHNI